VVCRQCAATVDDVKIVGSVVGHEIRLSPSRTA
jgi:hypothetical protein